MKLKEIAEKLPPNVVQWITRHIRVVNDSPMGAASIRSFVNAIQDGDEQLLRHSTIQLLANVNDGRDVSFPFELKSVMNMTMVEVDADDFSTFPYVSGELIVQGCSVGEDAVEYFNNRAEHVQLLDTPLLMEEVLEFISHSHGLDRAYRRTVDYADQLDITGFAATYRLDYVDADGQIKVVNFDDVFELQAGILEVPDYEKYFKKP